jgi:cytochrome P450 family 110
MKLPKGPSTLSFFQLFQWSTRPSAFLDTCAQRYGDIFTAQWPGFTPSVFVSTPEALEQVFTASSSQFESGQGNKIFQPFVGEYSLMLLDGAPHQRQRKLVTPPLHGERMRVYGQLTCEITEEAIQSWRPGSSFSMRTVMEEITLRIILGAVFGVTEGKRFSELRRYLSEMLELLGTPLGALSIFVPMLQKNWGARSPWGHFLHLKTQVDQLIYDEIAERRGELNTGRTDILTLLMSAHDESGQPMSEEELRDELLTLLITGHETSATALVWALYWIHHLPQVRDRLLAEVSTLGARPDPSAILGLPYLTAVCQETLRIYPTIVVAFPRLVKVPFQMMGYEFPVGTQIFPAIYSAHHREEVFPEPKSFKPERFLERQYSSYEYMPFGGGSHRCIGSAFALFEMKLILATMLARYEFVLNDDSPVQPVRRNGGLTPNRNMHLVVRTEYEKSPLRV